VLNSSNRMDEVPMSLLANAMEIGVGQLHIHSALKRIDTKKPENMRSLCGPLEVRRVLEFGEEDFPTNC
jgi:hypothetical protein